MVPRKSDVAELKGENDGTKEFFVGVNPATIDGVASESKIRGFRGASWRYNNGDGNRDGGGGAR